MGVSPGLDWLIALQENFKLIAQLHELALSFLIPNMAYQLPKPQLNMWGECGKNPQPEPGLVSLMWTKRKTQ